MNRVFSFLAAAITLFLMMTTVPKAFASDTIASGPRVSAVGNYFCMALEDPTPAAPKGKAYFSGIFAAEGNTLNPVRGAFAKFLQGKYAYAQDPTTFDSSIQCTGLQSNEEAVTIREARMKPGKQLNPDGTFDTGWTYSA